MHCVFLISTWAKLNNDVYLQNSHLSLGLQASTIAGSATSNLEQLALTHPNNAHQLPHHAFGTAGDMSGSQATQSWSQKGCWHGESEKLRF